MPAAGTAAAVAGAAAEAGINAMRELYAAAISAATGADAVKPVGTRWRPYEGEIAPAFANLRWSASYPLGKRVLPFLL